MKDMSFVEALREADRVEWPTVPNIYASSLIARGDGDRPCGCAIGAACFVAGRAGFEKNEDKFEFFDPDLSPKDGHRFYPNFSTWGNGWSDVNNGEVAGGDILRCDVDECSEVDGVRAVKSVTHLFDEHHWSHSKIADWLESIGVGTKKPSEMAQEEGA